MYALREAMRQWRLDLERGQKAATAPLYEAYKAELDRWKPTIKDAKRIEDALVATMDSFTRKLDEEKRAKERAAWEAAEKARREAEAKAAAAAASDLEAQREADAAKQAAIDAEKAAQAAKRDKVPGLRTVTFHKIEDYQETWLDIVKKDRDAVTAFIEDYVRRHHKTRDIAGVRVWTEKVAY
ncbi:hypothetical protein RAZWK3B_15443 [Roseobacter sp. AzwK-3b]|uniref:hypothetical protein n=1 Tax=Roseobacter sp. AzwK-3b TaxID=351016 RepID=UPI000156A4D7|nr:hypothetical protein [Roseobacter sp. AzwK-3b]EDM70804.1 hypothetical protein RAZWK3B_15443 [Roseobacter sp. AzwK-3b]